MTHTNCNIIKHKMSDEIVGTMSESVRSIVQMTVPIVTPCRKLVSISPIRRHKSFSYQRMVLLYNITEIILNNDIKIKDATNCSNYNQVFRLHKIFNLAYDF